jgi:hypothetical protein
VNAPARVDHLVVVADSLEQGTAWCEATLGVTPGPGGAHPMMGTHNRLLRVATVDFPRAYLEIIAIDPAARREAPARTRWFDMDDERLGETVRRDGPRLVHWVAQVPDVRAAVQALARRNVDRGEVVAASRMTPRGLLQWEITIRADGQRGFDGCLPTLIQWGDTHPVAQLPESGVTLHRLALTHPRATQLRAALEAVGLGATPVQEGPANLCMQLLTPRGRVQLESLGL